MIGWFVRGVADLAWAVKYAVHARWSLIVSLIWLFPLTGLGAAESGIYSSFIGVIAIALAFVSAASELAVAIFGLGGAYLAGRVFTTSQPAVLTRTKAGHEGREGGHGLRLFLAEVAGEPFVADATFKGRYVFCIWTVDDLVLFS